MTLRSNKEKEEKGLPIFQKKSQFEGRSLASGNVAAAQTVGHKLLSSGVTVEAEKLLDSAGEVGVGAKAKKAAKKAEKAAFKAEKERERKERFGPLPHEIRAKVHAQEDALDATGGRARFADWDCPSSGVVVV